jgi:hypothetical protein
VEASTATTPAEPAEAGSDAARAPNGAAAQPPENGAEANGERDESGRYLSREAAAYRRRLRDAEAERDSLRAQVDHLQTAEVERLAGAAGLQVANDIWTFGATLDTLRAEDGGIDSEAVSGLVSEIVKDRPGLQARRQGDVGIGRGNSAVSGMQAPKVGLSALLKPEGQR